jgi:hypothetical protein
MRRSDGAFHPETHFVVYVNAKSDTPSQDLHYRDSRAFVFDNLNTYLATKHLDGPWRQASVLRGAGVHLRLCLSSFAELCA